MGSTCLGCSNLLFWHEVARIQNDTIPKDGWEMAALAIGLGGAVAVGSDGLLLVSDGAVWRVRLPAVSENNGEKKQKK